MGKTRVTVTLDHELAEWIELASNKASHSQSEIIRICLREYIQQNRKRFSYSDKARTKSEDAWLVEETMIVMVP